MSFAERMRHYHLSRFTRGASTSWAPMYWYWWLRTGENPERSYGRGFAGENAGAEFIQIVPLVVGGHPRAVLDESFSA